MTFSVGDRFSEIRIVSRKDILDFAEVSGDKNPIHIDEDYAKTTIFKQTIAHGMLSVSYISKILGMNFPGQGAIYLSQSLNFLAPTFQDDKIEISVELIEILGSKKNKGKFKTICTRISDNKILVEGEATLLLPLEP